MAASGAAPATRPAIPPPTTRPAPAAPPDQPKTKPSRLAAVQVGRLNTPMTYVIYGPEGVGKTTLAVSAPDCILADIEDGSSELACARYPFYPDDPDHAHVPRTYQDVLDMIDDLTVSEHHYKTLAIDSLDRLEALMWKWMLGRDSSASPKNPKGEHLTSIEDYGYGKGYNIAVEEWRALSVRLDRLRYTKKMQIVLVGHAQVKPFKNPTGEDYDRWQLRLNIQAAGFLKEWAKITGFINLEENAQKLSKYGRPKGISTGMRLLTLVRSAAVDAKSRLALPDEVEVDIADPWRPLAEAVEEAGKVVVGDLVKHIEAEFKRIGDEDRAKRARPIVDRAVKENDAGKLQRFLMELRKITVETA